MGVGGEVKHYPGKKAELGKRSLKTQQMTSGSGSAAGSTAESAHRRGRRGPEKKKGENLDTKDEEDGGKEDGNFAYLCQAVRGVHGCV